MANVEFDVETLRIWEEYKTKFSKHYGTDEDDILHLRLYLETVKEIDEHNARYEKGLESYSMGINQFTDMTEEERKRHC